MNTNDFAYVVETNKGFDDAVVSVLKGVDAKGWVVFAVYDIKERMAVKGFVQKPLKIIEICSAKFSHPILNKNRLASLCMPCKINVFEAGDGSIKIAGMKAGIISQLFSEVSPADVVDVERIIKEIVDGAK